jgi:hypothetical protein
MEKFYYIDLPYNIRKQGKLLGAIFDSNIKSWYVLSEDDLPHFEMVSIDVPYEKYLLAKEHGAVFLKKTKCWSTCKFNQENLNNILSNKKLEKLNLKRNELLNNPINKLIKTIEKMDRDIDFLD